MQGGVRSIRVGHWLQFQRALYCCLGTLRPGIAAEDFPARLQCIGPEWLCRDLSMQWQFSCIVPQGLIAACCCAASFQSILRYNTTAWMFSRLRVKVHALLT